MTSQTPPGPPPGSPPPGGAAPPPSYPPPPGPPPSPGATGSPPPAGPSSYPPPPGYPPPTGSPPQPGYPPPPGYPPYPPPPGYPPYPAPPGGYPGYAYGPYPPAPLGPIGRTRSIGICILLAIVTLFIYTFVWVYKTQAEMKRYSCRGLGGGLGLLIYIIFSPATYFLVPIEVAQLYEGVDRRPSPVSALVGLWVLLPIIGSIIWFVRVQGALNEYWMSKGAPPP